MEQCIELADNGNWNYIVAILRYQDPSRLSVHFITNGSNVLKETQGRVPQPFLQQALLTGFYLVSSSFWMFHKDGN